MDDSVGLLCRMSRVGGGHMPAPSVPLFRIDFGRLLPDHLGLIMYPENGIGHFLVVMS